MKKRILSAVLAISMILSFAGAAPIPTQPFNAGNRSTHEHSFACYENYDLICNENHEHIESCFEHSGELVCGIDEGMEHIHKEEGYECHVVEKILTCNKQEHTHSEKCYSEEEVPLAKMELPETGFTEDFYPTDDEEKVDETAEQEEKLPEILSMDEEASEHEPEKLPETEETEEHLSEEKVLSCDLEEHIHNESCYAEIWECRKSILDGKTIEDIEDFDISDEGANLEQESPELPPSFDFSINEVIGEEENTQKGEILLPPAEFDTEEDVSITAVMTDEDNIASFYDKLSQLSSMTEGFTLECTDDTLYEEIKAIFDECKMCYENLPGQYKQLHEGSLYDGLEDHLRLYSKASRWVETHGFKYAIFVTGPKVSFCAYDKNIYLYDGVLFDTMECDLSSLTDESSVLEIGYFKFPVFKQTDGWLVCCGKQTKVDMLFPVGNILKIVDSNGKAIEGATIDIGGIVMNTNQDGYCDTRTLGEKELTNYFWKLYNHPDTQERLFDHVSMYYNGCVYTWEDIVSGTIVIDEFTDNNYCGVECYLKLVNDLFKKVDYNGFASSEQINKIEHLYDKILAVRDEIPQEYFLVGSDYYDRLCDAEKMLSEIGSWIKFNALNLENISALGDYEYFVYTKSPKVKMVGAYYGNRYNQSDRNIECDINLEETPYGTAQAGVVDAAEYVVDYTSQKIGDKYELKFSNCNFRSSFLPVGTLFTILDYNNEPIIGAEVTINGVNLVSDANGEVQVSSDACDKITCEDNNDISSNRIRPQSVKSVSIKYGGHEYNFDSVFAPIIYLEGPELKVKAINKHNRLPINGLICEYSVGDDKRTKEAKFGTINFFSDDLNELGNSDKKLSVIGIRNYEGEIITFDTPIDEYSLCFTENGIKIYNSAVNNFVDYIEIDDYLVDKKAEGINTNAVVAKFKVSRDVAGIFTGRYNLNEDGSISDGGSLPGGQGTSYKEGLKAACVDPVYFKSFNILLKFSDYSDDMVEICSSVRGMLDIRDINKVPWNLDYYYSLEVIDGEEIVFSREDGAELAVWIGAGNSLHGITTEGELVSDLNNYLHQNHLNYFRLMPESKDFLELPKGVSSKNANTLSVGVLPLISDIKFSVSGVKDINNKYCVISDKEGNILKKQALVDGRNITVENVVWDEMLAPYTAYITDAFGNKISDETLIRYRFHTTSKWDALDGYWLSLDTLTITEPESTNFKVDKVWKNTTYAELPNTITLQLGYTSDNTQWTEWGEPVVLHKEDFGISPIWNCEWTGLSKLVDNKPVSWSVKEIKIGEQNAEADGAFSDYSVKYSDVITTNRCFQQTITNTHTVEYTDELPSTGGRGVWYMYCIGLLCIGCVAAFWVYQRKKKQ